MPAIAVRFAVSHKMVQKIKYQSRDTGTLQPQTQKVGRKRILTDKHGERIRHLISENPSVTLEQLRSKLKVNCCLTTIWLELQRQRQTFKKNSERQRTAPFRRGGMSKKLEEKATST
jgi:transposase